MDLPRTATATFAMRRGVAASSRQRSHADSSSGIASALEGSSTAARGVTKAAELDRKWLAEVRQPGYVPPDASWPKQRPRRADAPNLRRSFEECGALDGGVRCHALGTAYAFSLLGGVLFGHSESDEDGEQQTSEAEAGEAVALLRQLAASNAVAACGLAMCLMDGVGGDVDEAQAVEHYTRAAEQGYEHAQHALGCALYLGEGTAALRVRTSGTAGSLPGPPERHVHAGRVLLEGIGVAAAAGGLRWLFAAGERGHVRARESAASSSACLSAAPSTRSPSQARPQAVERAVRRRAGITR